MPEEGSKMLKFLGRIFVDGRDHGTQANHSVIFRQKIQVAKKYLFVTKILQNDSPINENLLYWIIKKLLKNYSIREKY